MATWRSCTAGSCSSPGSCSCWGCSFLSVLQSWASAIGSASRFAASSWPLSFTVVRWSWPRYEYHGRLTDAADGGHLPWGRLCVYGYRHGRSVADPGAGVVPPLAAPCSTSVAFSAARNGAGDRRLHPYRHVTLHGELADPTGVALPLRAGCGPTSAFGLLLLAQFGAMVIVTEIVWRITGYVLSRVQLSP